MTAKHQLCTPGICKPPIGEDIIKEIHLFIVPFENVICLYVVLDTPGILVSLLTDLSFHFD